MNVRVTIAITAMLTEGFSVLPPIASALPPASELPEEVLRTEIILEGRSPVNGEPLSAAEYEELQAELAQTRLDSKIDPQIKQLIFLLQIRKFFKTIIPFY